MPLCNACQKFDILSFSSDPDGLRGYSEDHMRRQAVAGCPFCGLLIESLNDTISSISGKKDLWVHMKMFNSSRNKTLGFNKLRVHIGPLRASFRENNIHYEPDEAVHFRVAADPNSLAAKNKHVYGRYLGEDPTSAEQISAITDWLNDCLGHPKCTRSLSGTRIIDPRRASLPTRCIDVGSDNSGFIRLEKTEQKVGCYITLSHRWIMGLTELCQTTTENYAARLESLPLQTLPKTFQDAIWLTRALGERYLWIDSICIIQEGIDGDFGTEALKMADYYQQSLLTIAATGASIEHGLFPPSTRFTPYNIVQLPYYNPTGRRQGNFYVYQCDNNIDLDYEYGVTTSEMYVRGWVFQEWMLSRRILCHTRFGVFYQCQTDPPRNENFESIDSNEANIFSQRLMVKKHFDFQTIELLGNIWYQLVETYSERGITNPEQDRILALAGIAKEFKEALLHRGSGNSRSNQVGPLEYISGLWLRDIHHGLLWEMAPDGGGAKDRIPGLPTWSWASRMVKVEWPVRSKFNGHACEIIGLINTVGAFRTVGNTDQSSQLTSEYDVDNKFTSLRIRCQMQPVYIGRNIKGEEELGEAKAVTGHHFYSKHWRAACSVSVPEIISGWASIEESTMEKKISTSGGCVVQAFLVSTTDDIEGGVTLGYFDFLHRVLNVLFVQNIGGRRFERLGLGKLYGKEVSQGFREAAVEEIELL